MQLSYGAPSASSGFLPQQPSNGNPPPSASAASGSLTDRGDREMVNENFRVYVRVRPPLQREKFPKYVEVVQVHKDQDCTFGKSLHITERWESEDGLGGPLSQQVFTFDTVYDQESTQEDVYLNSARPAVRSVLEGYNATIIAYGQTGTGKTYTMDGEFEAGDSTRGIIPRAAEEIFEFIHTVDPGPRREWRVKASYAQIYNEIITDLMKSEPTKLHIRECKERGVYVMGLNEYKLRSPQDINKMMQVGQRNRVSGTTRMSEMSSRSHAIFTIVCQLFEVVSESPNHHQERILQSGKLQIVDLAGSEKVRQTGATGQRLEESKNINKSLSALGNVIAALTGSTNTHIPYRDTKLTRLLEDSLGGNCKTVMIANISPAWEAYSESLSTLKFANRAKNIKNDARINTMTTLQRSEGGMSNPKQEQEIQQLKNQLTQINEELWNTREKLQNHNDRMRFSQELEQERADDRAEIDKYKELLTRQRDVMIQLTARLNERDMALITLKDDLEAYKQQEEHMQEALDHKTTEVFMLQQKVERLREENQKQRMRESMREDSEPLVDSQYLTKERTALRRIIGVRVPEQVNEMQALFERLMSLVSPYPSQDGSGIFESKQAMLAKFNDLRKFCEDSGKAMDDAERTYCR